jgi:hypothetical protein
MTLPTSGPISLSAIQTEFGGTAPTSLSEYYAGGAYVPAGTSGTNGPVPSSGAISLSNFYGTSKGNTVTVGTYFDGFYTHYGFESGSMGSVAPTTWPIDGGTITGLYWLNLNVVGFALSGSHANSGWTNMVIDGTTFTRASASYSNSGYVTGWTWSGVSTNPYGTTVGATKLVTWS